MFSAKDNAKATAKTPEQGHRTAESASSSQNDSSKEVKWTPAEDLKLISLTQTLIYERHPNIKGHELFPFKPADLILMPPEKRDVEICQERLKYLVKNVQKLTNLADLLDIVKPKPINPDLNYGIQELVEKASHDFIQSRIAKRSSQKKGISKFSEKLNSRQEEFLKFFHSYRPLNSHYGERETVNRPEFISEPLPLKDFDNAVTTFEKSLEKMPEQSMPATPRRKIKKLANEPKSGPANCYSLYTQRELQKMSGLTDNKDKMRQVSETWKSVTDEEKAELKAEVDIIQQNHLLKLGEFYLTILNDEDRLTFEKNHKSKMSVIRELAEKIKLNGSIDN